MELTSVICDIAGFKITETLHFKDDIPTGTVFHIRTGKGNVVSRAFNDLVEPIRLLYKIRDTIT